ncbi:MAG: acyl-CoA reductase [Chitinophagia bacterium]|nr:acyl-CoA reductase [Chitinophagia bacterium]
MSLPEKLQLLEKLKSHLLASSEDWQQTIERATQANAWFTQSHILTAVNNIVEEYLNAGKLQAWISQYPLSSSTQTVGMVMAGNIPLVGFHDFLCGFLSNHKLKIKLSSKDAVLLSYIINLLTEWQHALTDYITIADNLKGCDAYIATGSNNTSRYFYEYFGKKPHLIRKGKTSVALLTGQETTNELELLANDIFLYYGLGCRSITQVLVPQGYNFEPLLTACLKYEDYINHHKYKNNYDYHLAIYLLNGVKYMTNGSLLLVENALPFSAVSVLHYHFYTDINEGAARLKVDDNIQAIIGEQYIPFGMAQKPKLNEYADNADTMAFLTSL